MKYLKAFLVAVIMVFTFGSAMAQIQVRARIGGHRHHWRCPGALFCSHATPTPAPGIRRSHHATGCSRSPAKARRVADGATGDIVGIVVI